jgi:hypothetical protein
VRRIAPQALLRLEGFEAAPRASWAGRTLIALARGHCRLRWFRLAGLPSAERFAALRLQVEAWRPFDELAARLAVSGEEGLAIAWDAAAVRAHLVAAGLSPERCQVVPEVLLQAPGADGLRLLQGADGFEAQCWRDGWLRASRWWAQALTVQDWQEFVHASGGDVATPMPPAEVAALVTTPWARHLPLDASADGADGTERRLVFAGGLALAFAGGLLAHQFWDVRQEGQALAAQIADVKQTTGPVLQARDATMAALDEVDKLAAWYAVPLPVDVVGQLHDTLARSGVQVKDLDLEGSKLRLGLLLSPTATRAGIVKDLQSGGWFTDVVEVRADNARGMVTMEMRIAGPRPPVGGAAPAGVVADSPLPAAAVSPSPVMAPAPVTVPRAAAPAPAASAQAPAPAPVQPPPARAPAPPREPAKPIIAKPDANGMPPPDVFNAVPNR